MTTTVLARTLGKIAAHLALIAVASAIAEFLRLNLPFGAPLGAYTFTSALLNLALVIYPTTYLLLSFYDPRRTVRAVDEYQILTVASIFAGMALGFVMLFAERLTSRLLLVYFYIVQFALMMVVHTAVRLLSKGNHPLHADEPPMNGYQRAIKRVVDVSLSAILLLVASPLMLTIAILIKLDSRGPVLFRQQRVGESGRRFEMLKFRSMSVDAESRLAEVLREIEGGVVHKHKNDPRVTRLGRILRRTSLDELPQLINVLVGDMSLVGPRPELPMFVEKYEPWQFERLSVPQGMTGWWQVNGRSDNPLHMNTAHDIYYVRNYSLLLDVRILLKTIWVVLRAKGAY